MVAFSGIAFDRPSAGGSPRGRRASSGLVAKTTSGWSPFQIKRLADGGYQGPIFASAAANVIPSLAGRSCSVRTPQKASRPCRCAGSSNAVVPGLDGGGGCSSTSIFCDRRLTRTRLCLTLIAVIGGPGQVTKLASTSDRALTGKPVSDYQVVRPHLRAWDTATGRSGQGTTGTELGNDPTECIQPSLADPGRVPHLR